MEKIICDVCNKNEANRRFKVKLECGMAYQGNKWISIDICKECYDKLFNIQHNKVPKER